VPVSRRYAWAMRCRREPWLVILAFCLASSAGAEDDRPERRVADPKLQSAIHAAIDKGVAYLKRSQQHDGRWLYDPTGAPRATDFPYDGSGGLTALALYALSASGVPASDAAITKGIGWVVANPKQFAPEGNYATYCVSLLVLALTGIDAQAHAKHVHELAQRLEDGALPTAGWSYDLLDRERRRKEMRRLRKWGSKPFKGDLSNTQFAVLALWAAQSMTGYKVRTSTWKRTRDLLAKVQRDSGEWTYGLNGGGGFSGTMTAAGVVSYVCAFAGSEGGAEHLPAARASEPAKRGLRAFATCSKESYEDYYFAYSVERLGTVLARPSADWYPAGARALVECQEKDGRWSRIERGDSRQVYETSLALLFLSRATAATITGK